MIRALSYVDELSVSHATKDLDSRLMTANKLRDTIIYLISFIHFVNTNGKQENEEQFVFNPFIIFDIIDVKLFHHFGFINIELLKSIVISLK